MKYHIVKYLNKIEFRVLIINVDTVTTARRLSSISRSAFEDGAPWPKTRRRAEESIDNRDRQQLPRTEEKDRHGSSITEELGKSPLLTMWTICTADGWTNERTDGWTHERTHARMILRDEILNTRREIRYCELK